MTRARPVLLVLGAVALVAAAVVGTRFAVAEADRLTQGLADDPRGGCPPTPNCVSTLATVPQHAIEVLACDADEATVLQVVDDVLPGDVLRVMDRQWVVYSRVMGFPDDVFLDVSERGVEVLSSSRVGASDLGVNRERVEALRAAMAADGRC